MANQFHFEGVVVIRTQGPIQRKFDGSKAREISRRLRCEHLPGKRCVENERVGTV